MLGQGALNFNIVSCYMIETGSYMNMHHRGFNTSLNAAVQNMFGETVMGQSTINAGLLSGIAGQIMSPTAYSVGEAHIENGWHTRRLRFIIHAISADQVTEWLLTGYSSHSDLSYNNSIDPNMHLYINNVITIRGMMNPNTGQYTRCVTSVDHVLTNPNMSNLAAGGFAAALPSPFGMGNMGMPGLPSAPATTWQTIRPTDILGYHSFVQGNPGVAGHDLRLTGAGLTGKQFSRRSNCQASDYLARALGSITSASSNVSPIDAMSDATLYSHARTYAADPMFSTNPVIAYLVHNTAYKVYPYFTYAEVASLLPNFDAVTRVWPIAQSIKDPSYNPVGFVVPDVADPSTVGTNWGASSNNARIATIISYSLSSVMADLAIKTISINSDNQNLNMTPTVTLVPNSGSLLVPGLTNDEQLLNILLHRFQQQIIPEIAYQNGFPLSYMLAVRMDLFGNSFITVQAEGEIQELFTMPTFADACMPPTVTMLQLAPQQIATDISTLATTPGFNATYSK